MAMNIDDILTGVNNGAVSQAAPQGQPSAQPSAQPQGSSTPSYDIDKILNNGIAKDQNTGEDIPIGLSGNSPSSAMNKSPLSAWDRFQLSMGNQKGNIEYLQKKFPEGVAPISPDSKELAVRQNGSWYRVDPDNGNITDPWKMTKSYLNDPSEFVKDMADLGPMGIGAGVAAGAAAAVGAPVAAATTGGLAAVGAATAVVRTSLGRIMGTYDATPGEQLWDTAFESLLNVAGGKILAGVKPTASWVAKNWVDPVAKYFADVVPTESIGSEALNTVDSAASLPDWTPGKSLFKKIFASPVGEDAFDTMVKNPERTKALMATVDAQVGGNVGEYHNEVLRQQTDSIKSIADTAQSTLNQIYGKMRNKLIQSAGDDFSADTSDALKSTYEQAIKKGIGKLVVGDSEFQGPEALEYLGKNGMKNASFQLLPQKELLQALNGGANIDSEIGYLAENKTAHQLMQQYYDRIGLFGQLGERPGQAGAQALLDFKKRAGDIADSILGDGDAAKAYQVKKLIDNSRTSIDQSIRDGLDKIPGGGALFDRMNASYSELKRATQPLLQASQRAMKSDSDVPYQQLLGQFLSNPGKNATQKSAIDTLIGAADEHGLSGVSSMLKDKKLAIQIGQAAKAFNPLSPGDLKTMAVRNGGDAVGIYGAIKGNKALVITSGLMKALGSPKLAMAGADIANSNLGAPLTQSMNQVQKFLVSMPKSQLEKLINNDQLVGQLANSLSSSVSAHVTAKSQMYQQIMQSTAQGGGQ